MTRKMPLEDWPMGKCVGRALDTDDVGTQLIGEQDHPGQIVYKIGN